VKIEVTAQQIAKLPKWAQDHISQHERRCCNAESSLRDYLDSQSESLVYTRHGLHEKRYIQDDRVTFKLKNGEVTIALRDDVLECNATYGSAQFMLRPWSSNVVHLKIVKDQA
jgi:hypothetical protein